MMGAQMGKTAGLLNVIGHTLDDAPAPVIYVGPTRSNVDSVIEPQVTAMLKSAPSLWAVTDQSRDAKKLAKTVNGVSLRLAWAGSPTELASQSAKIVLIDEVDRMEPIAGEGDPVTLAEGPQRELLGRPVDHHEHADRGQRRRGKASGDRRSSIGSRRSPRICPVTSGRSGRKGTRFEWAVPCPHCAAYFIPRFRHLWWPDGATPRTASTRDAPRLPGRAARRSTT